MDSSVLLNRIYRVTCGSRGTHSLADDAGEDDADENVTALVHGRDFGVRIHSRRPDGKQRGSAGFRLRRISETGKGFAKGDCPLQTIYCAIA
jgi:hypothetical protein